VAKSATPGTATKRKPKLGQNFLTDHSAAQRIVDALGDISQRTVIEIGPGRGMLTDLLVRRARKVIGIELDHILAAQIRMKYATLQNVEILESDFVTVEWDSMVGRRPGPLHDLRPTQAETVDVVGNLPYYVTSDIVLRILQEQESIGRAVVMVQREVADRITAEPGSRDYGLLSATVQMFARAEKLFTLPPGAFNPPPQVHSSVVRLTMAPRAAELQVNPDAFQEVLKVAFAQKRKTLANNLKVRYDDKTVAAALKAAGVRADARAEALSLEKLAAVFRGLSKA
jgi:16S rRNA (adenine1518-N6/adenine1519-N6)-dimethyltransferase